MPCELLNGGYTFRIKYSAYLNYASMSSFMDIKKSFCGLKLT